jgi:hypothetical protein
MGTPSKTILTFFKAFSKLFEISGLGIGDWLVFSCIHAKAFDTIFDTFCGWRRAPELLLLAATSERRR